MFFFNPKCEDRPRVFEVDIRIIFQCQKRYPASGHLIVRAAEQEIDVWIGDWTATGGIGSKTIYQQLF